MDFKIIRNTDSLQLLHEDKFQVFSCNLSNYKDLSLQELENFLNFYKENKDLFISSLHEEKLSKTLVIKEKESGWRTPIEIKLVFNPTETEDYSIILNRKIDYVIKNLKFDNVEKIETEEMKQLISNIKSDLKSQFEEKERVMDCLITKLEDFSLKKEENFNSLFTKFENLSPIDQIKSQLEEVVDKLNRIPLDSIGQKFDLVASKIDSIKNFEQNINDSTAKISSLDALNTKLQNSTTKLEQLSTNLATIIKPDIGMIYKTIENYTIYDTDANDTNYTGNICFPYGDLNNIEEIKNNTLTTGVGLNSTTGVLTIIKSGTFSEIILGGNVSLPGGWGTSYWQYCTIIFFNNYDIVAVYKLKQGNSNGSKWNGFKLGFTFTKIVISGYCSFSKISFKA